MTWTMLGAQGKFNLAGTDKGMDSAGINLTSYLKFAGNALPNVPVYVEVALAEQKGFDNLYKKGTTEFKDGAMNLLVDTVFDPVYYYGGQAEAKTYLGHFKGGIETKYVNWTTGYKYAKLPPHTNVNWNTIDKEWEAGYNSVGGYNQFEFGKGLKELISDATEGLVQAEFVVAPNRSADRAGSQYGLYAYADATINGNQYVDFQLNQAYGTSFDDFYKSLLEEDFIVGYKGSFGDPKDWGSVTVKANYLMNMYGSKLNADGTKSYYKPSTSDVGNVRESTDFALDNMAGNVNVTFSNDTINAVLGGRFRGVQASMMYVEEGADDHTNISDQLGSVNHWRAWANVNVNLMYDALNIGIRPYAQATLNKDAWNGKYAGKDKDNFKIDVKPYFTVDLNEMIDFPAVIKGSAEMNYMTKEADYFTRGSSTSPFAVLAGSLRYTQTFEDSAFKKLDVLYSFDNTDSNLLWNTVLASCDTSFGWSFQAGAGLRTAWEGSLAETVSPFGAFLGGFTKLPVLQKPTFYVQGMYGMDPYNEFNDGPTAFRMSDSYDDLLKDGVNDYANNAAFRIGLQWDL